MLYTHHHPSSGAGTIGQIVIGAQSGLSANFFPNESKKGKAVIHVLQPYCLISVFYSVQIQKPE
jgi:hypothetical protein